MSLVIYPSEKTQYGPWLLDIDQLKKLDFIIERQMDNLSNYREKVIESEFIKLKNEYKNSPIKYTDDQLKERVNNNYKIQKFNKELKIKFKSGKTVLANSFKEISMNKDFENDVPKDFSYKVDCVDIEAEITNDLWSKNEIRFKVNTLLIDEAKELFYEFESWLKQVSPPLYVKYWRLIGKWVIPIFFVILLLIPSSKNSTKDHQISEAYKLLEDGIKNEEIAKSLEILLSLETGYEKVSMDSNSIDWTFQRIMKIFLFFFGLIIISNPPDSIIGICKSEKKLMRWKLWIKIVTYIIPVMIILPILINLLSNKL